METTKDQYELNFIKLHQSNPHKIFAHLKYLSNDHILPPVIYLDGKPLSSALEKADAFNKYFNSIFTVSDFSLPPVQELPTPTNQLSSISIEPSDVYQALSNLKFKLKKSPGCDNICPQLLLLCLHPLLHIITSLFQQSYSTASLPQEWKTHKIVPIHKSGDKTNVTNYRPISLLCIISKVLESIVYNKIIPFIRPKISKKQFGFFSNRSCTTQLLSSHAEIFKSIEEGSSADVIYLDFKKAFDSVPHHELLYKMWKLGITGPLWLFFKNYLCNRYHYTVIDNTSSNRLPVISGVPQGSILGPLLFLIYINDLPSCLHYSTTYLFADDSKLIFAVSQFSTTSLQSDIDSLHQWCTKWNLTLNTSKCICMRFTLSTSTDAPSYYLNGEPLPLMSCHRDLGVLVSRNLLWSSHIKSICMQAYKSLNFIRRSIHTHHSSIQLRKHLFITLVRSRLTYCSQLWRPNLISDIVTLEKVQRRATKYITADYTQAINYKDRLIKLDMLPLMYWLELQDILFLVKCLQHPSDNFNIFNFITFSTSTTRFGTSNKLKFNYRRTTITRHFFFNRIVKLWNSLPAIDISLPFITIKKLLYNTFRDHFIENFCSDLPCTFHYLCPCSKCCLVRLSAYHH